jgi:hypothetical protein
MTMSKPSGWQDIQGLSLEQDNMLDELAHGVVTEKSMQWICDLIRNSQHETVPTQEEWRSAFENWWTNIGDRITEKCDTRLEAVEQAHFGGFIAAWNRGGGK